MGTVRLPDRFEALQTFFETNTQRIDDLKRQAAIGFPESLGSYLGRWIQGVKPTVAAATWRPRRLELYLDGISRANSTAANTNTSDAFGIFRWGWGFSTNRTSMATSPLSPVSPHPGPPPRGRGRLHPRLGLRHPGRRSPLPHGRGLAADYGGEINAPGRSPLPQTTL